MKHLLIFLLIILILPAHAQEDINEEQIAMNGYIDGSGKVLLTGYATEASLSNMPFLDDARYTPMITTRTSSMPLLTVRPQRALKTGISISF